MEVQIVIKVPLAAADLWDKSDSDAQTMVYMATSQRYTHPDIQIDLILYFRRGSQTTSKQQTSFRRSNKTFSSFGPSVGSTIAFQTSSVTLFLLKVRNILGRNCSFMTYVT